MILVSVRQHDGSDVLEPVGYGREIREDEVHSRLGLFGKEHPAVDDEQRAVELEDRHIAADFTEPTDRQDPKRARFECRGLRDVLVVHYYAPMPRTPARSMRNCCSCSGVASTSGRRTPPAGSPCMRSAALVNMTPWVRNIPV